MRRAGHYSLTMNSLDRGLAFLFPSARDNQPQELEQSPTGGSNVTVVEARGNGNGTYVGWVDLTVAGWQFRRNQLLSGNASQSERE